MSERHSNSDWWLATYRRAFPRLQSAVQIREDGWAQRAGVDRVLTLACGRTYTVDEKVRSEDWPDILLEQWSDEERRAPGWVQKPLACDFIAYAYAPSGICYLLPWRRYSALGASMAASGSNAMARSGRRTSATSASAYPCRDQC